MATNRIITIAIITVLVLLIIAVIYSKFRWLFLHSRSVFRLASGV